MIPTDVQICSNERVGPPAIPTDVYFANERVGPLAINVGRNEEPLARASNRL